MKKVLLPSALFFAILLGWISREVPLDPALLIKAKREYKARKNQLRNRRYVTIVDYRQNLFQQRLYVYDLEKQQVVLNSRVAHAFRTGILYPTSFSNVEGSEQSCYGTFITAETFAGKFGNSMRLDGISSTNTKARARAIIFHEGYTYSAACYMTAPQVNERLIQLIKGKSLVVVYI